MIGTNERRQVPLVYVVAHLDKQLYHLCQAQLPPNFTERWSPAFPTKIVEAAMAGP
jgi:hypothetical protein